MVGCGIFENWCIRKLLTQNSTFTAVLLLALVGSISFAFAAPPDAPTNLQATPGNQEVTLTWDAPSNSGGYPITNYIITYAPLNGADRLDWERKTIGNVTPYTIDTFKNNPLVNGLRYTFSVQAVNYNDEKSEHSDDVTAVPKRIVPGVPGAFELEVSIDGQVRLIWKTPEHRPYSDVEEDDGGSRITHYKVYYKTGGNEKSYNVNPTGFDINQLIHHLHTVHIPEPNKTYQYRVSAVNANGEGEKTGYKTADLTHVNNSNSPKNVQVIPGSGGVKLTWDAAPGHSGKYSIFYSLNVDRTRNDTFQILQTESTSITIYNLINGKEYKFIVGSGSNYSKFVTATPQNPKYTPDKPTGLDFTRNDGSITLSWSDQSKDVSYYIVYYKQTASDIWSIHNKHIGKTSVTIPTQNGINYDFKVKAVYGIEESEFSNVVRGMSLANIRNLSLDISNDRAELSWDKPLFSKPIGYFIWYKESGGDWNRDSGIVNKTNYTITGLEPNVSYDFRVITIHTIELQVWKDITGTTTKTAPYPPTNFSVTPLNEKFEMSWDAPYNGGSTITSYYISCILLGDAENSVYKTSNTTTATIDELINGEEYRCTVSAINEIGRGDPSKSIIEIPYIDKLDSPKSVTASVGYRSITLSWEAVPGASEYEIDRRTGLGHRWTPQGTTSETSITITSLDNGRHYQFRIFAINDSGKGNPILAAYVGKNPIYDNNDKIIEGKPLIPGKPNDFTLSIVEIGYGEVKLEWTKPDNLPANNLRYTIEYKHPQETIWKIHREDYTNRIITLSLDHTSQIRIVADSYPYPPQWWALETMSTPSNIITVTPDSGTPDKPTIQLDNTTINSVKLFWDEPNNNGAPIINYAVEYKKHEDEWNIAETTIGRDTIPATTTTILTTKTNIGFVIHGIESTPYDFRVFAVNGIGYSESSNIITYPASTPYPPTNLRSTPGQDQITISWNKPHDGGADIEKYTIEYKRSIDETWKTDETTGTSHPIFGLEGGSTYDIRVYAVNRIGQSTPTSIVATPLIAVGSTEREIGYSEQESTEENPPQNEVPQSETEQESGTQQIEQKDDPVSLETVEQTEQENTTLTVIAFNDTNNNGIQDADELGIYAVMLVIIDSEGNSKQVFTNHSGIYIFEDMTPQEYTIYGYYNSKIVSSSIDTIQDVYLAFD